MKFWRWIRKLRLDAAAVKKAKVLLIPLCSGSGLQAELRLTAQNSLSAADLLITTFPHHVTHLGEQSQWDWLCVQRQIYCSKAPVELTIKTGWINVGLSCVCTASVMVGSAMGINILGNSFRFPAGGLLLSILSLHHWWAVTFPLSLSTLLIPRRALLLSCPGKLWGLFLLESPWKNVTWGEAEFCPNINRVAYPRISLSLNPAQQLKVPSTNKVTD